MSVLLILIWVDTAWSFSHSHLYLRTNESKRWSLWNLVSPLGIPTPELDFPWTQGMSQVVTEIEQDWHLQALNNEHISKEKITVQCSDLRALATRKFHALDTSGHGVHTDRIYVAKTKLSNTRVNDTHNISEIYCLRMLAADQSRGIRYEYCNFCQLSDWLRKCSLAYNLQTHTIPAENCGPSLPPPS